MMWRRWEALTSLRHYALESASVLAVASLPSGVMRRVVSDRVVASDGTIGAVQQKAFRLQQVCAVTKHACLTPSTKTGGT